MSPPPTKDGLSASAVHLPAGPWSSLLEFLVARFTAIPCEVWRERMQRGLVLDSSGAALPIDTPYQQGQRIYYYREVTAEVVIPFNESIVYHDEHLLVADKPHFLPVSPVGNYVHETLLSRLRKRLSNPHLTPLHRIDRGTAGLVMFSVNPATRDAYQALFRNRQIQKHYEAIAPALPFLEFPLTRASRIIRGDPFVLSREVEGEPNAETRIDVVEKRGDMWRYALYPTTGKKHQLRVHMAALGAPLMNDDFYPVMQQRDPNNFSCPLKLLAKGLAFIDPIINFERCFASARELTFD